LTGFNWFSRIFYYSQSSYPDKLFAKKQTLQVLKPVGFVRLDLHLIKNKNP